MCFKVCFKSSSIIVIFELEPILNRSSSGLCVKHLVNNFRKILYYPQTEEILGLGEWKVTCSESEIPAKHFYWLYTFACLFSSLVHGPKSPYTLLSLSSFSSYLELIKTGFDWKVKILIVNDIIVVTITIE